MTTRFFDFVKPKDRPARELARDLVVVLLVKLTIIGLAAVFIFGPAQRPKLDATDVAAHLIGPPVAPLTAAIAETAVTKTAIAKTTIAKTAIAKTAISKAAASRSAIP